MVDEPWHQYRPGQRWLMLSALFLVATTSFIDRNLLGVVLEPIRLEFDMPDWMLGLLGGAPFAIFYSIFGIPVARWADHGDRKRLVMLTMMVWAAMTAFCGLAPWLWLLFVARMGVGVGEAGTIPPSHSLIADYFPPESRARAYSAHTLSSVAGGFIALAGGGWVAGHYGWRAAFLVMATVSVPVALFAMWVLKEPRRMRPIRPLDDRGERSVAVITSLLRNPLYRRLLAAMTFYAFFVYGPATFTVVYAVRVLGLDLAGAGAAFGAVSAVGSIAGAVLGGVMIDRLAARDARWLFRAPAIGVALASPFALVCFGVDQFGVFLASGFMLMAILAATLPSCFAGLQLVCSARRRAMAIALVLMSMNALGMTIGPLITGLISDALSSHGVLSLRYAMMLMTSAMLPAAVLLWSASRRFVPGQTI